MFNNIGILVLIFLLYRISAGDGNWLSSDVLRLNLDCFAFCKVFFAVWTIRSMNPFNCGHIGLYTPINYFGGYDTCSHKDGGRSIFSLGKPLARRTT